MIVVLILAPRIWGSALRASNLSLENTHWDSWLLFLASEQLQADTAGDTVADVDTAADGDTASGGGGD